MLFRVSVLSGLVCVDTTSVVPRPQCESWLLQTCASQKGLFVSGWDWLATSALLAPPQTLARVQMLEPGQASHLCSPSQTKRLHCADSSLTLLHITNRLTTVCQGINVDFNTFHWSGWKFPLQCMSSYWIMWLPQVDRCFFMTGCNDILLFTDLFWKTIEPEEKWGIESSEWSNYVVLNNVMKSIIKSKLLIFALQSIRITTDCYIAGIFIINDICWYNYIAFFLAGSLFGSICSIFLFVIVLKFWWQNIVELSCFKPLICFDFIFVIIYI